MSWERLRPIVAHGTTKERAESIREQGLRQEEGRATLSMNFYRTLERWALTTPGGGKYKHTLFDDYTKSLIEKGIIHDSGDDNENRRLAEEHAQREDIRHQEGMLVVVKSSTHDVGYATQSDVDQLGDPEHPRYAGRIGKYLAAKGQLALYRHDDKRGIHERRKELSQYREQGKQESIEEVVLPKEDVVATMRPTKELRSIFKDLVIQLHHGNVDIAEHRKRLQEYINDGRMTDNVHLFHVDDVAQLSDTMIRSTIEAEIMGLVRRVSYSLLRLRGIEAVDTKREREPYSQDDIKRFVACLKNLIVDDERLQRYAHRYGEQFQRDYDQFCNAAPSSLSV